MDIIDLRERLKETDNKIELLSDLYFLMQYGNITYQNIIDLSSAFLTDQEIIKLLEADYLKDKDFSIKLNFIEIIRNNKLKFEILKNVDLSDQESNKYYFKVQDILESFSDNLKIEAIKDKTFLEKFGIETFDKQRLIESLQSKAIKDLLTDNNFIKENPDISIDQIKYIMIGMKSDEDKKEILDSGIYKFENYHVESIIKSFKDENKIKALFLNEYGLDSFGISTIAASIENNLLMKLYCENREFFKDNNVAMYKIVKLMAEEKQLNFVSNIEELDLSLDDKRRILISLPDYVKEKIDSSQWEEDLQKAFEMHTEDLTNFEKILNEDLKDFKGLDDFIRINPMDADKSQIEKIKKLATICPNMTIRDDLMIGNSSGKEYLEGEKWIDSILEGIDEKWTDIQKVAYIDNKIGKKISYTPDFGTEVFNREDARALWKIINSGYGICNGIAQVEKYILDKLNIKSEIVSSGIHSFLKLKDIEIPTENGIIKGDTILDPTWNLTEQRYGSMPLNFCRSYEQIRKEDIDMDGIDRMCHKNDQELSNVTLSLDEKNLRKIYSSIGLADKDGNFPVKKLIEDAETIDKDNNLTDKEKIKMLLKKIEQYNPNFAECQNSTMVIIQTMLNQENLSFSRCVVNRVYEKADANKKAVAYVYVDLNSREKIFYYADKENKSFKEATLEEFEKKFDCYEKDLEETNGIRPWKSEEKDLPKKELAQSSGKIVETQGDER